MFYKNTVFLNHYYKANNPFRDETALSSVQKFKKY